MKLIQRIPFFLLLGMIMIPDAYAYYTTKGQDIVDRKTGEKVILRGFGLGCWLLPEGYMWGIRKLDRPRQFEQAIVELVGEEDAEIFWKLYYYSEEGFRFLDSLITWCSKYRVGVIWDMHGAPGAQNAENISDSDGEARLWIEKTIYWPRCIELWYKIAERYKNEECIIGYDLLNEPLLRRYDDISVSLLRELYVAITDTIRTVDKEGIIFIEGDDWAQNFEMLESIDWDPHLVIAFHSYPPTTNQRGLGRWDRLRKKYNIPLWHGETGEQGPPYHRNISATTFLESSNVGWSWWTHKKMDRRTQPWNCPKTLGFQQILEYWQDRADRPSSKQAKEWLFDQARKTHSDYCEFLPEMVGSLVSLNPNGYLANRDTIPPEIIQQPEDVEIEIGYPAVFHVRTRGYPLLYQWMRDGKIIPGEMNYRLRIENPSLNDNQAQYAANISNSKGSVLSNTATLTVNPFTGLNIPQASIIPQIDAREEAVWKQLNRISLERVVLGERTSSKDLSGYFKVLWDNDHLYFFIQITDDVKKNTGGQNYDRDGVEIYIDADNSKSDDYGDDEFQFRYNWNEPEVMVNIGEAGNGIRAAQTSNDNGYIMEIAFPWKAIHGVPKPNRFIGIDMHVNDNDDDKRECKITWNAVRDNSYQTPSVFGTMRLSKLSKN